MKGDELPPALAPAPVIDGMVRLYLTREEVAAALRCGETAVDALIRNRPWSEAGAALNGGKSDRNGAKVLFHYRAVERAAELLAGKPWPVGRAATTPLQTRANRLRRHSCATPATSESAESKEPRTGTDAV